MSRGNPVPTESTTAKISSAFLWLAFAEVLVWASMFYLFPALLPHWEANTEWSKTQLSGAFTLAIIFSALAAPLFGRLIDKNHGRSVLAGSTLAGGVLLLALSQSQTLTQFYLIWIGLGVCMAGALYEPCFAFVTHLLGANAKRTITIITLIAGFAGTVSFPTAHFFSQMLGWRGAVIVFAVIMLVLATPTMWFSCSGANRVREATTKNSPSRKKASLTKVLALPVFWLLAFAFAMGALNHGVLFTHILPLLQERGVHNEAAVLAAAMIGPMQVVGRLAMMAVESYVTIFAVVVMSFVFTILSSLALLGVAVATVLVVVFVVLQGSGYGVTSITRPVVTAEILGRENFGAISGAQAVAYMGATAASPTVAALIWEVGGYDLVILSCVAFSAVGLLAFLLSWRIYKRPAASV